MQKPYNFFKANQISNAMRLLVIACVAGIVLVALLYVSVGENRNLIAKWFGIKTNIQKTAVTETSGNDAGINGAVSVNQNINVRSIDRNDHLWGPLDAPVALIIYDDFECPFCAQFYETVNQAKAEFGNSLVVAVRNFPLMSHEQAIPAALAAECAAEKGKYWEMYHELFDDNKSGTLSPESIRANAEKIGLETVAFEQCLTNETYKAKILAEKEEVKSLGVIGTPASFINNEYTPGALPYDDFTYPDGSAALGLRSLIQRKLNESN